MTVTAIDINIILLDVFTPDSPFSAIAQRALERCARAGDQASWIYPGWGWSTVSAPPILGAEYMGALPLRHLLPQAQRLHYRGEHVNLPGGVLRLRVVHPVPLPGPSHAALAVEPIHFGACHP